jgi:hypothetical protein
MSVWSLAVVQNRSAYTDDSFVGPVRLAISRDLNKKPTRVIVRASFCRRGARVVAGRAGTELFVNVWVAKPSVVPPDVREDLAKVLRQAMFSLNGASVGAIARVLQQPTPDWWRGFRLDEKQRRPAKRAKLSKEEALTRRINNARAKMQKWERAARKAETIRVKWKRELARLLRLSERRLREGVARGEVSVDLDEAEAAFELGVDDPGTLEAGR